MKLRALCLAAAILFSSFGTYAQNEKPSIHTEEEFRVTFDGIWRVAVDKGLIKKSPKPDLFISDSDASYGGSGIYFINFFFVDYETQMFAIGHEIGHWVIARGDEYPTVLFGAGNRKKSESFREYEIREECEASVLAAQFVDKELTLKALRYNERAFHQTRAERILSAFFSPAHLVIWTISIPERNFINPLGKYKNNRDAQLYGPALNRAILVLEGKRQSCGE